MHFGKKQTPSLRLLASIKNIVVEIEKKKWNLVSCDGDEVHRVVNSFQDPQDGGQSFL